MTVKYAELAEKLNSALSDLALYDITVRGLDLPGVPDTVWANISHVAGELEDASVMDERRYEALDFDGDNYYPSCPEEEADDPDDHSEK